MTAGSTCASCVDSCCSSRRTLAKDLLLLASER